MGISIGFIRTIFKGGAKTVAKTAQESAPAVRGTIVRPSLPGVTSMERQFGNKLYVSETRTLANGSKQTTTAVYGANGQYIGKGGDQGLAAYREKIITRQPNESIFGGDKIEINKTYHETMGMTAHNENIVKEYLPSGIMEHSSKTTKYHNWDSPETSFYDRTKSLNGETLYSQAVKAKGDVAKQAEAKALAAKQAAEKAAAELKAKQPRINISKALNRDINELVMKETKLPNGTIERTFADPETGKILAKTQDLGIGHKEWIYGGKADMIFMSQVGKSQPYIVAKKGNYTQINKGKYTDEFGGYRHGVQYYNDGTTRLERTVYDQKTIWDRGINGKVTIADKRAAELRTKNPEDAAILIDYPQLTVRGEDIYSPIGILESSMQLKYLDLAKYHRQEGRKYLQELNKDAERNLLDFNDLFSAYKA